MSLRGVLGRLALVAGGLLVPLALVEVGMRLAGAGQPAELDSLWDRRIVHYRAHPSRTSPWGRGERGALRVAVIGDSFTVGATNDPEDTFPLRLERLLNMNRDVRPARVGVFAQRGWTTHEELKLLTRALRWRPDLVVLAVFLNDPEHPNDPALKGTERLPQPPEGRWAGLLRASRVLAFLYQAKENLRSQAAREAYMERIYDPEYDGWTLFESALVEFAGRCREYGVPLAAIVLPTMAELDTGYPSRFAHERIAGALERAGIVYRDFLPAFEGTSPLRMAAYPSIDPHPSEIGHRVIAHELFEFLLEEGFVEAAYKPESVYVDKSLGRWMSTVRRMRSVVHPWEEAEKRAKPSPTARDGQRDGQRGGQRDGKGEGRRDGKGDAKSGKKKRPAERPAAEPGG